MPRPNYTSRDAERNHIAQQMNRPMGLGKADPKRRAMLDAHTSSVVLDMHAHQALIAARAAMEDAARKVEAAQPGSARSDDAREALAIINQLIAG